MKIYVRWQAPQGQDGQLEIGKRSDKGVGLVTHLHHLSPQIVHAQRPLVQTCLKRRPLVVITQLIQHHRHVASQTSSQRLRSLFGHGSHVIQAVVSFRQDIRQPSRHLPPHVDPLPIPADRKNLIHQFFDPFCSCWLPTSGYRPPVPFRW